MRGWRALAAALVLAAGWSAAGADDLATLQPAAVRAAVNHVSAAVVQIRTIGSPQRMGSRLLGGGSTSGLIVSEDGYLVSSTLGLVPEPASILVHLPDGRRLAAARVATDHSRQIVLLKVAAEQKLTVPVAAPENAIQVGAWAIAVGRTFEQDEPNLSVGIISAVNRIFGKVVQTDAKVSPLNYGGPLVDIRGRVCGVLVPMAPQDDRAMAGLEWYDSGIGFAVPLTHIKRVLPRLKRGEDLYPGILGVTLKAGNPHVAAAVIAVVQPNSPARAAGLQPGDRVLKIDDSPVETTMRFRGQIAGRYSGASIRLTVRRDLKTIECNAILTDSLAPFEHAFVGVLPERGAAADQRKGIGVRFVYPQSPADRAGLQVGDQIVALAGQTVTTVDQALAIVNTLSPGDEIAVQLQRQGAAVRAQVVTGRLPTEIPSPQPRRRSGQQAADVQRAVGPTQLKLPERAGTCPIYVPPSYHPDEIYGVVVWLPAPGAPLADTAIDRWKQLCDAHDLILLTPSPVDPQGWSHADVGDIRKLLHLIMDTYHVDPRRIVVHGYQVGGTMAYVMALAVRELVRGVAVVDASLPMMARLPANDPIDRLAVYVAKTGGTPRAARIEKDLLALEAAKYPVTTVELVAAQQQLSANEIAALACWIDSLDRF